MQAIRPTAASGQWIERRRKPRASASRALAVVEPSRRSERSPAFSHRPSATFLAHLIATRQQSPQTRERRRAEPADAVAAYKAAIRLAG